MPAPPHSAGLFVATAVALRAVALYAPPQMEAEKRQRLARARQWLFKAKPESTEDLTYRLLGLGWASAPPADLAVAIDELAAAQRPDGGWAQTPAMKESDAYSTGQALTALRRAGWQGPGFDRGIEWLLKTQAPDGSWHVKSRINTKAAISPPYFESGFPYGHDQYVSCAATAWAVMALAEALPPVATPAKPRPLRGVAPAEAPWMTTALFGSPEEVATLSPKLATPAGTTVLMMASDNPAKVKALLAKGADPRATAKTGFDALLVACMYPGNKATLEALLAAGADPKPRPNVKYKASALPLAAITGDASMVQLLISKGASPEHKFGVLGFDPIPPFMLAANFEHTEVMRTLAAAGANIDATDPDGITSLGWSALGHKVKALQALLELGARRDLKDKFGLTALDHTKDIAHSPTTAADLLTAKR